jgi:hypothetical protein
MVLAAVDPVKDFLFAAFQAPPSRFSRAAAQDLK